MSQQAAERTVNLELSHDVALVLFALLARIEEQRRYRQVVEDSAEVVAL